jgi:ATP-binding cassette subfamily B protein
MKKTIPTKKIITYYWRHAWRYPILVVGELLAIPLAVAVNNLIPPLIVAHILGKLSNHQYVSGDVMGSLGPELISYTLLVMIGGVFAWRVVDQFVWRLEGKVLRDIAQEVFDHLMNQSANFHANHFTGSMVSHTNKVLGSYIRIADTTSFQVLPMLFGIAFSVTVLAGRAPIFALALAVLSIAYIFSAYFITAPARRISADHAAAESRQTGLLADAITNVMAIKSFARSDFERQRFAEGTEETRFQLFRLARKVQSQMIYFTSFISAIEVIVLFLAVISVVSHGANIATVYLMLTYTMTIVRELFQFSNQTIRGYNRSLGDATDMVNILHEDTEVVDPVKPEQLRVKKGTIGFHKVTFTHDGSNDALFKGLSLDIRNGEKIGLVGHSGSGKTTFTRLLQRFSDIDDGQILIDGQNVANITQEDLHSVIAYVPQEPLLFHRSIRENIAYGDPKASEKDIITAAKRANAHDFIETLPKKYGTLVGERGVKLSGGQRQRIAIARAMLKNAPILALDEATSALDSESEVLIQDALWKLMEGRTAIVIAHRLSTIQKMDRILVMDNGAIVEQGSHKELLAHGGIYAKLWSHQSGGFIEE